MIARTPKKIIKSNQDALAAFVQKKAEIDTTLSPDFSQGVGASGL
jgi:hypothetical protein